MMYLQLFMFSWTGTTKRKLHDFINYSFDMFTVYNENTLKYFSIAKPGLSQHCESQPISAL